MFYNFLFSEKRLIELVRNLTELSHGSIYEGVARLPLAPALRLLTVSHFPPPHVQTDGVVRHLPVLRVVHWHRVEVLSPDQLARDVLARRSFVAVDRGEQIVNHPVEPGVLRKQTEHQKLLTRIFLLILI